MIEIIKAHRRHYSDFGWLKTYWLFSFDNYYDPANLDFGSLRVFNDDVVQPAAGFPTHSHREMEIVTVVLSGELTHEDSTGSEGVIRSGDVQRMSAGTGISHSEHNRGDRPLHFYQIWIRPDVARLAPGYEQVSFPSRILSNRLVPVASGQQHSDAVKIHSDSAIYLGEFGSGVEFQFTVHESRGVFVYLTEGHLAINGNTLEKNDQARINSSQELRCTPTEKTSLILIDVPYRH
jgi:redox-sensitive bicupin YhaK (pirin superfamily)